MLRLVERQIEVAHVVMQKHIPDDLDETVCRACWCNEYPCHPRMLARELLIEIGHLVPDLRARRRSTTTMELTAGRDGDG